MFLFLLVYAVISTRFAAGLLAWFHYYYYYHLLDCALVYPVIFSSFAADLRAWLVKFSLLWLV